MWLRITKLLCVLFPLSEDEKNIMHHTPVTFKKMYGCRLVQNVWVLSSFKQKEIRSAIHLNKFHNHVHAQKLLGQLLTLFLDTYTKTETALLIPIPLSSVRRRVRGHNQVESILKYSTINESRFQVATHLLLKVRDTKPQTSLDKKARKENLRGAYDYREDPYVPIAGRHIILIDDVMTTGTTLTEAKLIIEKQKPASILCIALAH